MSRYTKRPNSCHNSRKGKTSKKDGKIGNKNVE